LRERKTTSVVRSTLRVLEIRNKGDEKKIASQTGKKADRGFQKER